MLPSNFYCSPFERRVLEIIETESRRRGGSPVSTLAVSAHVGSVPERTLRWWLAKMEDKGMVRRPSPKGGWLPAPRVNHQAASP